MLIQVLVGVTQYYIPAVYGGVDNAKAIVSFLFIAPPNTMLTGRSTSTIAWEVTLF